MLSLFLLLLGPQTGIGAAKMQVNLDELNMQIWPSYFHVGSRFAAAPSGVIMGMDPSDQQLVLISPGGESRARLGGKGSGPGEFVGLDAVAWLDEADAFVVSDRKNRRISMWHEDGRLLKEYSVRESIRNPVFDGAQSYYFLRKANDGKTTTLSVVYRREDTLEEKLLQKVDRKFKPLNLGWDPSLIFGLNQKYLAVNYGAEPVLQLLDRKTGVNIKSLRLELTRTPVSESYYQEYKRRVGRRNPELAADLEKPDYWPYVNKILLDDKDRIWVFLHQEGLEKKTDHFVFDTNGRQLYKGQLVGWAQCIQNNKLHMVHGDEEEELFLSSYQIPF